MTKRKENYRIKNIKSLLTIVLGNLLLTCAYAFFTVPNDIIDGGATSTSLLISHYLHIDIAYVTTIVTFSLLIFGRIALGKVFFYRSLFSSVCYVTFFNFFHFAGISFSFHPLIIVLFAGIFVGVGHYLCLRENTSTVGYDAVAIYLHKKSNRYDMAMTLRVVGILVLILGLATFGLGSVLYGIIFTVIQTQVIYLLNKSHEVDTTLLKVHKYIKSKA